MGQSKGEIATTIRSETHPHTLRCILGKDLLCQLNRLQPAKTGVSFQSLIIDVYEYS